MDILATDRNQAVLSLRESGLSYPQIGEQLGISQEAARSLYRRASARSGDVAGLARFLARPSVFAGAPLPAVDAGGQGRAGRSPDPVPAERPDGRVASPRYVGFSHGFYDIEASGLRGDFGRLFSCACAHELEGDVWVARIDDPKYLNKKRPSDDSKLAKAIYDHLISHDVIVSWNGKRGSSSRGKTGFDVPMLNTRLVAPGSNLPVFSRYIKHIDLLKEAGKYLQLRSLRLVVVQEFLELAEEKNAILPNVWNRALDNDPAALDYIVDHNIRDVKVLRLVFEEFRKLGMLERPTW